MHTNTSEPSQEELYPRRLHDLEQRFGTLFKELTDSPQKEALSVLHGMMLETWRQLRRSSSPIERGLTIDDIADLSRPAHTHLLRAGIPICEHMTNLAAIAQI